MCNPGLALALNALSVRSMRWMLIAAGISTSGGKGAFRAQGLALILPACCVSGLMTMILALRVAWRSSTVGWRAVRTGRGCSTIFAPSSRPCDRGAGAGAHAATRPTKPPRRELTHKIGR